MKAAQRILGPIYRANGWGEPGEEVLKSVETIVQVETHCREMEEALRKAHNMISYYRNTGLLPNMSAIEAGTWLFEAERILAAVGKE